MCPRYKCGQQNIQHIVIIPQNCFLVSNNVSPKDILNLEVLVFHSPLRIYLPRGHCCPLKASQLSLRQCPAAGFSLNQLHTFRIYQELWLLLLLAWQLFIYIMLPVIKYQSRLLVCHLKHLCMNHCLHFSLPLRTKYC